MKNSYNQHEESMGSTWQEHEELMRSTWTDHGTYKKRAYDLPGKIVRSE